MQYSPESEYIDENYKDPASPVKHRHNKWTSIEDERLKYLVQNSKKPNWKLIASRMPNRNSRQCQERWEYYLSPSVNNSPWSHEEDVLLLEKYKEIGSKWSMIAKCFSGRTNTNVKNRYLALQRSKKIVDLDKQLSSSSINETVKAMSPPQILPKDPLPNIFSFDSQLPSYIFHSLPIGIVTLW